MSKRLDPTATAWPASLQAIAATALLVKQANKLTARQNLTIVVPHHVKGLLCSPPDHWLSNGRITQYQVLLLDQTLLDQTQVSFSKTTALNPATLLPEPGGAEPQEDCFETLETLTSLRVDLTDISLKQLDWMLFSDVSSFVLEAALFVRYAGAAVVTLTTVWSSQMPKGTSAKKAELTILTRALELSKGKTVKIYTDNQYAFATAHIHGAIYKERGLNLSR